MAFQRVPQSAEADVIIAQPGVPVTQLTFVFRHPGGYGQAALDALANAVDGWGGIVLRPIISSECAYVRTEVRGLDAENDLVAQANAGAGSGALAGAALPANVAFAVRRTSGLTGRSARGRVYFTGLTEVDVAGQELSQARADSIVAALENLRTSASIIQWIEVIASRFHNKVKRTEAVTFDVIGHSYFDRVVDSQRGRLPD